MKKQLPESSLKIKNKEQYTSQLGLVLFPTQARGQTEFVAVGGREGGRGEGGRKGGRKEISFDYFMI